MRTHIHCEVAGAYARSDSHFAGVRGSANAMTIVATFGKPWELCESITATFYDANGENPNVIPLIDGKSGLANKIGDMQYAFAVPSSAAAHAGIIELDFDGIIPQGVTAKEDDDNGVIMPGDEFVEESSEDEGVTISGPIRLRAVEKYEIVEAQQTITDEWGMATPTEVEKLIAILNRITEGAADILALKCNPPKIVDGYWYVYNTVTEEYEQICKAQGDKGDKGEASGALTSDSVGTDELKDGSVTESKLSPSIAKATRHLYAQVDFKQGRQNVKKNSWYRLWFDAEGLKTNDRERDFFGCVADENDSNFRYLIVKEDMTVRLSAQVAMSLGSEKTVADGGMRSLHIFKVDGKGEEIRLGRSTIQDWSKTRGRYYTIAMPPRVVELKKGDRLKLVAYMKKNDSLESDDTWLLAELIQ